MSKKKIYSFTIIAIIMIAILTRIVYVNVNSAKISVEHYQMGETVDFTDDFYYKKTENFKGYQINVKSATLMTAQEFIEKHNLDESTMLFPDIPLHNYVIDLEADFTNTLSDNSGIYFINLTLYTEDSMCNVDDNLWSMIRPEQMGQAAFSVKCGTTKTINIPYCYNGTTSIPFFDEYNFFKNAEYKLCLSQFPTERYIDITVTENK